MTRVLILCTHNSARSQLAEALTRFEARQLGLDLDVHSAGTEATAVKPQAVEVMRELGLDLSAHTSKTLFEVPDPWNFEYVITVCDSAAEQCPHFPARTRRLHYPFPDPSGGDLATWRAVRDRMRPQFGAFVRALAEGGPVPTGERLAPFRLHSSGRR